MLPRQSKLIKILQSELENYKSFTNKYQQTKSLKESNNELLLRIKEDINNLIEVEDKELVSIIEAFDLNVLEKKLLTNNLLITKKILSMNKEEGLNINLEESQKQSITTFLSHIETLKYFDNGKLISQIKDIKEIEYIIEKSNLDEETKTAIVYVILDINNNFYKEEGEEYATETI